MLVAAVVVAVVNSYQHMLRNKPEKQRLHLHSRSLKSQIICIVFTEYSRLLCTTDTNYNVVVECMCCILKKTKKDKHHIKEFQKDRYTTKKKCIMKYANDG